MKPLLLFIGLLFWTSLSLAQDSPEQLAQAQLDAYNARNIEAFLAPYAEDVAVYTFPQTLQYRGKITMRSTYTRRFNESPDLHCTLVSRMVQGDIVIDQESVIFRTAEPPSKAIAIYKIKDGKIAEVYFISGK
ncbi:MAG: nuclear transport factor 2 family protein [Sphingobacteriaceae bacterium]|nr:nuclear transport factor 2 family protein [Sphingobacteriaceae bacterium]